MKNICIVGYGAIGPTHATAIEKLKSAKFYAVCEINPKRRAACVQKYSVVEYSDFDEMLGDSNIDSVHICTPHYLHFEMAKKALLAGKEVICEKPVTMTEKEFDELCEIDKDGKVCVVLQNRLNPSVEAFKLLVDSGKLGKVKTAKAILTWSRGASYYAADEWRGKWATEGGGVLINQSIHTLDYFGYLLGEIKSVKAQMINYSIPEIEVEDTLSASLRFEDGYGGIFFATNAYGDNSAPLFEVIFEKGVARYEDGKLYVNGQIVAEDAKPKTGKMYWGRGHEMLFENYYDKGERFTLSSVRTTMKALFSMYKSAKNGGVEVKL